MRRQDWTYDEVYAAYRRTRREMEPIWRRQAELRRRLEDGR